jgi:2-desacetyl-2-hydroxyethyl bacteriochlorophyllide A dehydrogenase
MSHPDRSHARRLVFTGKQEVRIEPFAVDLPGKGEVLLRTQLSLMSTGTENIVFNRLFDPGTHWDNWVKYPFYPGYTSVGIVEAVGDDVVTLSVGDRAAFRVGHRSHAILAAQHCQAIPEELPSEQAVWFALAKIAFLGAQAAHYQLGDSVLVIGAGPIGQMSLRWARVAGAVSILLVDSAPDRMHLGKAGGATEAILLPIEQAEDAVLEAGGGKLPRVVIDSTGHAAVFAAALGLAAAHGRVVLLGDTGQPERQVLTPDVITRGLTIVGVHDSHNTDAWNDATITTLFFNLAAGNRFPLEGLNSHRFKPEQCAEAYAVANRDRARTMGILFDWTDY